MEGYRNALLLLVLAGLTVLGGASCRSLVSSYTNPLPPALPPSPSLQQIISVVNRNSSQIASFSTNRAVLSGQGFPTLRASAAFQRPRRFRLRAEMGLTGPELDLGSNDELFWIWVRRNEPQAIYYCRHEQFAASPVRHALPIDPDWLIEALGIAEFDPALPHQGPFPLSGGRFEIRTVRETADGPTTKVTVVDGVRGVVLQQHLFDPRGQLTASAVTSQHRRDPLSGLIMPRVVDVRCPKAQFSMRIDLGNVEINRPLANPMELWTMPRYEGWPAVDLGSPNLQFAPAPPPVVPPAAAPPASRPGAISSRPRPPQQGWNSRPR